jgi:hypothetical protein
MDAESDSIAGIVAEQEKDPVDPARIYTTKDRNQGSKNGPIAAKG